MIRKERRHVVTRQACVQTGRQTNNNNNSNSNGQFVQAYHEWRQKKKKTISLRHLTTHTWFSGEARLQGPGSTFTPPLSSSLFFSVTVTEPGGGVVWRTGEKGRCWCACPPGSRSACAWKCCKNHSRASAFYFSIRRVYFCSSSKWIIFCYVMIKPLNQSKELRNRAKSDEFSRMSGLKFKAFKLRKYILEFSCVMTHNNMTSFCKTTHDSRLITHYLPCLSLF